MSENELNELEALLADSEDATVFCNHCDQRCGRDGTVIPDKLFDRLPALFARIREFEAKASAVLDAFEAITLSRESIDKFNEAMKDLRALTTKGGAVPHLADHTFTAVPTPRGMRIE